MAREPVKQKEALRRQPDGSIIKVWIRRCERCRCWFGTPEYRDQWCCQGCEDAAKRREKSRQNPREKKTWPTARKVER